MTDFIEGWNSELDPLDSRSCDFDFDAVSRALGEASDECGDAENRDRLVFALRELLEFISDVNLENPDAATMIGRRAVAVLWVINPDYFSGHSLSWLANRLGCSVALLSQVSAPTRRKFGVHNRGQAHGWSFKDKEAA